MATEQPKQPRQPKLRFSCDACGVAKLKCDRAKPACGRCVNYGLDCVYSASRKMGRPRRDKLRSSVSQPPSDKDAEKGGSGSKSVAATATVESTAPVSASASASAPAPAPAPAPLPGPMVGSDDIVLDSGLLPSIDSNTMMPPAWNGVDDGLMMNLDPFDQGSSLMAFASLNFNDRGATGCSDDNILSSGMQFGPIPTSEISDLGGHSPTSVSTNQPTTFQPHDQNLGYLDDLSMPFPGSEDHDCQREAHEILEALSSLDMSKASSMPSPDPSATSAIGESANEPSLDRVLRLNRAASEQLGRLLTCPCARSPNMALLYASMVSRVLISYQQAASCMQTSSWTPTGMTLDATSHNMSPVMSNRGSVSSSNDGLSTWSSTTPSTFSTVSGKSTPASIPSMGLGAAPTKMAVGTFDVDDMRVQAALKIQLCLGEMRRTAHLIDQFTASHHVGGQPFHEQPFLGSVDNLYQSLDSWIRCEHSRIADTMKLRLRELIV